MNKDYQGPVLSRPNRIKHSYTQSIKARPEEVFPLLCPVRELDWVPGWNPDWVISDSGVAEAGCVFQTPAEPSDAIWFITRHEPETNRVEMIKVTPGHTVGKLEISLSGDGNGGTQAQVSYSFTSLGPAGDNFLHTFTESWYAEFMKNWEDAMNHYFLSDTSIA